VARLLRAHALPALLFLGSTGIGGDAAALAVHHNTSSARSFAATAASVPGRLWAEAELASVTTVDTAAAGEAKAVSLIERWRHCVATYSWIRSPGLAAHTAFIQVAIAVQRRTGSKAAAGAETLVAIGMICFIALGMVGLLTLFSQHWQQQAAELEAKQQHQYYAATATMDPSGFGSLGATPVDSMRSLNMPQPSPRFPGEGPGSMNSIPGGAGMDRGGSMGGAMASQIDRGSPRNPFQSYNDPPQAQGRSRKNVCC